MTPGTTADESGIDAQALAGTPVGGPGGSAACDTCNRRLTDGQHRADAPDADADTVVVYATFSVDRMTAKGWGASIQYSDSKTADSA